LHRMTTNRQFTSRFQRDKTRRNYL